MSDRSWSPRYRSSDETTDGRRFTSTRRSDGNISLRERKETSKNRPLNENESFGFQSALNSGGLRFIDLIQLHCSLNILWVHRRRRG